MATGMEASNIEHVPYIEYMHFVTVFVCNLLFRPDRATLPSLLSSALCTFVLPVSSINMRTIVVFFTVQYSALEADSLMDVNK